MNNPYESLSHGLMVSKLWLCEELEKIIEETYTEKLSVCNLGCWTNILALLLLSRKSNLYNQIIGYDIDSEAIDVANKICDAWQFIEPKVINVLRNANDVEYNNIQLVINCSVEHIASNEWFTKIPVGTLVCIQSSNSNDENWNILNYNPNIDSMHNKYPLQKILFQGIKEIRYDGWGYDRFMIIGIK
jgi:hypothetical protein